jgi:hypothetical protein
LPALCPKDTLSAATAKSGFGPPVRQMRLLPLSPGSALLVQNGLSVFFRIKEGSIVSSGRFCTTPVDYRYKE